ncbi:hypothetical protein [Companilactobacillus jidongensis]|uniref:hypothetical protein n=1 Tax=Companilactobacillus jidongensis TaxID=2486006 RepID=UPI000F7AABBF|nr:hypothetical protein [Companilactobacillus jidongensis]
MEEQRQELVKLLDTAYQVVQDAKFADFREKLVQFSKQLNNNEDYIKILLGLRTELLQADLSLKIKDRISGLPTAYSDIYNFVVPQLKEVDAGVLAKYTHYGFIPLKFGSTVKY